MASKIELDINGKKEYMSIDTFIRWSCLIDAIDVISEKCTQMGLAYDDETWIKPNAIEKYINDRYPSMRYNVLMDLQRSTATKIQ
jgi:hypothetical protein